MSFLLNFRVFFMSQKSSFLDFQNGFFAPKCDQQSA